MTEEAVAWLYEVRINNPDQEPGNWYTTVKRNHPKEVFEEGDPIEFRDISRLVVGEDNAE